MKWSQLESMIRKIVQEEVKAQLPGMISEMYIKRIVAENTKTQRVPQRAYHEVYEEQDEEIPEPMQNSDEGIYQQSVLFKENNPFRDLYEGVKPIGSGNGNPGVPLDALTAIVQRSKKIQESVMPTADPADDRARARFEEQRLARYREQLDSKVVK